MKRKNIEIATGQMVVFSLFGFYLFFSLSMARLSVLYFFVSFLPGKFGSHSMHSPGHRYVPLYTKITL